MGFAMWSRAAGSRWRSTLSGPSASLAALALVAAPAPAATSRAAAPAGGAPPVNVAPPRVFGGPVVGHMLTGFPGAWGGEPLELGYQWRRCPLAGACADIPGATTLTYSPAPDDAGLRIQLRVTASSGGASQVRDSDPTEPVPGGGEPAPAGPATPPAGGVVPASGTRREAMLHPFPVVRVRGRVTPRGTLFTLFTVRAPAGAAIAIRCAGGGCRFRDRVRTVSGHTLVRLTGLERRFSPGARIVLRITAPGRIGKYTRIAIRRGRPPARRDGCVTAARVEPIVCPIG
jgi:hypothetical protein